MLETLATRVAVAAGGAAARARERLFFFLGDRRCCCGAREFRGRGRGAHGSVACGARAREGELAHISIDPVHSDGSTVQTGRGVALL